MLHMAERFWKSVPSSEAILGKLAKVPGEARTYAGTDFLPATRASCWCGCCEKTLKPDWLQMKFWAAYQVNRDCSYRSGKRKPSVRGARRIFYSGQSPTTIALRSGYCQLPHRPRLARESKNRMSELCRRSVL